jgi:hypothetical protein
MNDIITLEKITGHIERLGSAPGEVNELVKKLKSPDFDPEPVVTYISENKVFLEVFSNFNPDIARSTADPREEILSTVKKLDTASLRNILFTCSILSLNSNDMSKIILKKIIISAYFCKDIIEKVNFYRKTSHNSENFFLYCLFHDIGELFGAVYFPDLIKTEIYKDKNTVNLTYLDNVLSHNEIGYMMARKWKLPSIFSYICLNHNKLEYRKFTSDFIYIINTIAVSDAMALELLDYETPFTSSWDVGHSIYKIGLREEDIYTESGLIGSAGKKISKILSLFSLK